MIVVVGVESYVSGVSVVVVLVGEKIGSVVSEVMDVVKNNMYG